MPPAWTPRGRSGAWFYAAGEGHEDVELAPVGEQPDDEPPPRGHDLSGDVDDGVEEGSKVRAEPNIALGEMLAPHGEIGSDSAIHALSVHARRP